MNEQNKKAVATTSATDFVRGVITEMKRVTWPTRDEWVSATVLTIALVVTIGVFTFLLDQAFGKLFDLIHPTIG